MVQKKLLIVDDDTGVLEFLREFFDIQGFIVRAAPRGSEALKILQNESYNVIILDITMPDMSGIDLCKKIRKEKLDVYIIGFSGLIEMYDSEVLKKIGFNACYRKPAQLSTLLNAVNTGFDSFDSDQE